MLVGGAEGGLAAGAERRTGNVVCQRGGTGWVSRWLLTPTHNPLPLVLQLPLAL